MSIVDLTDLFSSDLISPALSAIADYESDNVRDDEQPHPQVVHHN